MSNLRTILIAGWAMIAVGPPAAGALTWTVPGDSSNTCSVAVPSCDTVAGAVAAASAGDIIDIDSGTFDVANVAVDKSLTINGSGVASTFLNVTGPIGLRVRADDITISDLTVQNAVGDGIRLDAASVDGLTVEGVNFTGNSSDAIQIGDAPGTYTNTTVDNCVFTSNVGSGIRTNSTSDVTGLSVTNSTFSGGGLGIYQSNDGGSSKLSGLTVSNCNFQNTTGTAAIYAEELRDSVIEDSTFTGNARGILIFKFYATSGVNVGNLKIQRNQFTDSVNASVQVQIHNTPLEAPLEIDDNQFSQNVGLRSSNLGLIHVNLADTQTHAEVSITDNHGTLSGTFGAAVAAYGVMLRGNGPIAITGNVFDGGDVGGAGNATNPPSAGVYLRSSDTSADFNAIPSGATFDIRCNRIFGFEDGFVVFNPVSGSLGGLTAGVEVTINDNALVDNQQYGIANGPSPTLDAENNYWGCAAGPGNPGCDDILGDVDADPAVAAAPACVGCLADADCSDSNACTGAETCNVSTGVCQSGTPLTCDDGSLCTQDSCDPGSGCVFDPSPASSCLIAGKTKLQLVRNTLDEAKDKVSFTWTKGTSPYADFGTPETTTDYALCIYDANGSVLDLNVPAASTCQGAPCWKKSGKAPDYKGVAYKDKTKPATNDGVVAIRGKASTEGKAGVVVKAKGSTVPIFSLGAGLSLPVTAQVVTSNGPVCWEGTFGTAKKNDGSKFSASDTNP